MAINESDEKDIKLGSLETPYVLASFKRESFSYIALLKLKLQARYPFHTSGL